MIGLDTNVLARYLAQDDVAQSALATQLIEDELTATAPGFVSLVVLAELCWVLSKIYSATMDELVETVQVLLDTPRFHVERRDVVQAAIRRRKAAGSGKAGLVDALIAELAASAVCVRTVTFDRAAARTAGMVLLVKAA